MRRRRRSRRVTECSNRALHIICYVWSADAANIDGLERENILRYIYFTSDNLVLVLNVYLNLNMLDL